MEKKDMHANKSDLVLGINGLGRIGKLTLWHHVGRKFFKEIVINMGRSVGNSMKDLAHYIERDSPTDGFMDTCMDTKQKEQSQILMNRLTMIRLCLILFTIQPKQNF